MSTHTRLDDLLALASGQSDDAPAPVPAGFGKPIAPEGPLDAPIAIVGESAGVEEWQLKKNFVGRSGQKLNKWLQFARIDRGKCFILNTYPFLPESGSILKVPESIRLRWREWCTDHVRRTEAKVIVCLGNEALDTFTGLRDITKRRGSVYEWEGRKVIGVIHPAMVLRNKDFEQHCRRDMERIKKLVTPHEAHHAYCGCARRIDRTTFTPYTEGKIDLKYQIRAFLERSTWVDEILSIDIETPKIDGKRRIFCVGFAFSPREALVLPWEGYQDTIKALVESPCKKVGHNFVSYDRWWLARAGTHVRGRLYDTLAINHALDPAARHSLDFLQSVYTWEPYYKDEGKGHDIRVIEKDIPAYLNYCGMDAMICRELLDILGAELDHRGLVPFYEDHYEALFDPMHDLMMRGVRIDHERREQLLTELLTEARGARDELGEIAGEPLYTFTTKRDEAVWKAAREGGLEKLVYTKAAVEKSLETLGKKTVSGKKLQALLYDKLGVDAQYARRKNGDVSPTIAGLALKKVKMANQDREDVTRVVELSSRHTKAQKLASFLYPGTFDPTDGRFRFTLKLNTEASRFASTQAPDGVGRNSQNSPRDKRIRSIVLPEPGHVLYEPDGAQVESKLCFVYTGDPELIHYARMRSHEWDGHKYTASILPKKAGTYFGLPLDEIPSKCAERQVAKAINHAAQRAIQPQTAQDTLLRQDERFNYSLEEVEAMLEAYHRAFPAIRAWQARIRKEIKSKRRLTSSWGHTWDVRYEEVNDELYRRAYSWKMQRDCAGYTNQLGFIPLWRWLKAHRMQSRIMLQEHDAIVCSCPVDEVYDVAEFLTRSMEQPVVYDGVELSIPVEHKLGRNWGDYTEFAQLPDRKTFEAKAMEYAK